LITESCCEDCGAQQVNVVYKSEKTRFKDGSEEKTGCIFCLPDFVPLVEKHRAVASRPATINKGRGVRGGARGGRGAVGGNSRGRRAPKDKMAQLAAYFV